MRIRSLLNRIGHRLLYPITPARFRLPLLYRLLQVEGGYEPELFHLEALCKRRGVAIDIGANAGFFSYRLSSFFEKVYAFDANRDLLDDLRAYNPGNIEVTAAGISSAPGELTLYTPVLRGRPLTGWASLAPGNCPDTDEHIVKTVPVRTLDSFEIRDVSFIKIDVEGHEAEVLKGAKKTLLKYHPVLLIEIRERNLPEIRSFLGELGYRETTLKEEIGIDGSEGNYLFVPGTIP